MKSLMVITLTLLPAVAAVGGEQTFSASRLPPTVGLKQSGRIVIRNDHASITAFRFFGEIREALVSIRAVPRLVTRPFGDVLFDSSPTVETPAAPYLAPLIREASRLHGVDPRLVVAVVRRESAFQAGAVSPAGAGGLMQLMPGTARYLGCPNVFDPRENVLAGTRYLRTLLDVFHGDLDLALAAYNAGPGAVQRYNGVPPYAETRAYVAAVRAHYERALRR